MAEKKIIGRAIQKHDIEANWLKATNFTPMQGEIIVYDKDENYNYERIKIGDGTTNVNALPFVDDTLRTELLAEINAVDDKVDEVSSLVGDKKVSEQITTAIDDLAVVAKTGSWNDLENRPLVMESITITYDGSTEGYITSDPPIFYKVSDLVLTKENVIGQSAIVSDYGFMNTKTITEDMIIHIEDSQSFTIGYFAACIAEDGTIIVDEEITFPEKGIYFCNNYGFQVTSLVAENVAQVFDEKYIPYTIARKENIVQSDWSNGNKSSLSYVKNKTHYYYKGAPIVEELSFTVTDEDFTIIDSYVTMEEGKKYKVVIDEVSDICTAVHVNNMDAGENYIELTPTIEGFGTVRSRLSGGVCTYISGVSVGDHIISVYEDDSLKQLDEMFIPDTIARVSYIDEQIETHNASDTAHSDIRNTISNLNKLVGDSSVSEQIGNAIANNQSDWNVNDASNHTYIKNKPFYTEFITADFVKQQAVSVSDDLYTQLSVVNAPFIVGQTYNVIFNGTNYECIAWAGNDNSICIGNGDIYGGPGLGGDEPFACDSYDDGSIYLNTSAQGSYTIAISGHIQVVHKIDNKYLPDMIGAKGTEKGAEIFNDYEYNEASGMYSHAEGSNTTASSYATHAEGNCTISSGMYGSHAEGDHTVASHGGAHSEGYYTKAVANNAHAEGKATIASGQNAHSEGEYTVASGEGAHAEGLYQSLFVINLTGEKNALTYEIVGGLNATTYKDLLYRDVVIYYNYPVRCTSLTIENNVITHITVDQTINPVSDITNAAASVYIGSLASGEGSHAEGMATIAAGQYQHVQGKYNKADTSNKYAHIVGNGTAATSRSNAHTLDWNGNAWFAGDIRVGGTSYDNAISLLPKRTTVTLSASAWTGSANPWSQVVTMNGVTANSKIDLQPSAVQIVELHNNGITLMIENNNGVTTAYALGTKPTVDYTMQALITEVITV